MKGKLIIISAPSGSGKTTIVQHLLRQDLNLYFSISATSRKPRGEEKNGAAYYFLSLEEFKEKIRNNEFLEWEEVYENQYYGTLKSEVEKLRASGKNVLFDIDVIGGLNLKKIFTDESLAIFIQAPSMDVLFQRLKKRATDSEQELQRRIDKAEEEMKYAEQFDIVIVNDDLNSALQATESVVRKFIQNQTPST